MVNKNDEWFVGIFKRYGKALRRYLRRFSVGEETAADIAQEAFLRTYTASVSENIKYPRAFLYRAARNLALNEIRDRKRSGTHTVADFDDLGVYDEYSSLDAALISREDFQMLCNAIEELPERCQKVFLLRKVYQYSYKEISVELGIAVSTIEKHVAKGVTSCHRYLCEHGNELGKMETKVNQITKLGKKRDD